VTPELANVDLTEIDRAMADVELRAKRMAPAFRELRRPMRRDQSNHAKQEEGPSGKWPPRSPLTEARRRARNRGARRTKALRTIAIGKFSRRSTPKRLLGRLPAAVVTTVGELYIRITSRVADYSGVHQRGGKVGRRAKLPARPFLWMSDPFLSTAREVLGKFLVKGWKR
jgi:phage gpG-like protein